MHFLVLLHLYNIYKNLLILLVINFIGFLLCEEISLHTGRASFSYIYSVKNLDSFQFVTIMHNLMMNMCGHK